MSSTGKIVVVMADDDPDDCMFASNAFEESNMEGVFLCVEDGVELLDYLQRPAHNGEAYAPVPALILLDLNMPRKDGRQVLKEIKSIPGLEKIPIVVFTTSTEEEDLALSRQMGANSFITKPAAFDEWVGIMNSLARNWITDCTRSADPPAGEGKQPPL